MKKFDLDRPEMSEGPVNINPDHFKVIDLADDIRKQSSWLQYYGKPVSYTHLTLPTKA